MRHAIRRVLVFPVNGYLNRLQALASSAILAQQLDAPLLVCWTPFRMVPGPASETFSSDWCQQFARTEAEIGITLDQVPIYVTHDLNLGVVRLRGHNLGEQALMGVLGDTLAGIHEPVDLVIVAGGSFDLTDPDATDGTWSEDFLAAKRDFYRALPLHPGIESAASTAVASHPEGFIGLHLRYSDRSHQAPMPRSIQRALETQAEQSGVSSVFIASDTDRAREHWTARVKRMGLRPFDLSDSFASLAAATSAGPAMADWRVLGRSRRLVHFAESSYAVEACVAAGSWRESSALPTSSVRALAHRGWTLGRAGVTYPSRHWGGR